MTDASIRTPDTPGKVNRVIRSKAAAKPVVTKAGRAAAKPAAKKARLAAAKRAVTKAAPKAKPPARTPGSTDEQAEQIAALRRAAARLRREVTSDPAARRALLKRIAPKAAPTRR